MTPDIPRTDADASTPEPVTRRTVLKSTAAGIAAAGGATAVATAQSDGELNAVAFDLSNLPELGGDACYEGWAIFGEEKVSTGTFSKGEEYVFEVDRDLAAADEIVVTIEPGEDDEPGPSGIVLLQGAVADGEAELSFPVDFSEAAGTFLLNTPTADVPYDSGIWFLEAGEVHVASLDLPELPDGWTYEGWAVHDGQPLTTGRFDDPSMADDAAPYSGDDSPPSFPGEDFATNAPEGLEFPIELTDGESKAVLSVEPDLDGDDPTGPAPFQVKPLAGEIPADAGQGEDVDLPRNEGTLPEGTATLHEDAQAARRPEDEYNAVAFDLSNLPELGEDAVYEGWAIFGEEKVSTGTFSRGQEYVFGVDRDLMDADELVVTVEPAEDDEPGPSGIVLLQGEVADGEAELSFPVDFSEVAGTFLLNTPTADVQYESGIWFLEVDGEEHVASLDLPELPGGWTYEGWAVIDGTPVTTGRFDDPTAADDAAPYSGEMDGPGFPGEDFATNAPEGLEFPTDLTDGDSKAVISVEPDLDGEDPTGSGPFQIKPLAGEIPADAGQGESVALPRNEGTLPDGCATLYEDVESATDDDELNALALDLPNLPELPGDAVYEGWAIFGEEKVSTGTFTTDHDYVFGVDRDLSEADEIVVTIEPEDDDDPEPSGVIVLHGALEDGEAELSFPVDLSSASGSYLLNTPTAPDVAGESGIWFLEATEDGPMPTLDLPDLSNVSGWTYEGWAVHQGQPITTGRFDDPTAADDAAPFSGDADGPGLPGEDFVQNAPEDVEFPTDLADGDSKAVITVEPDLDGEDPTGPGPYDVKPLAGEIPADAEVGTSYDLGRNDDAAPSGAATLYDDVETALQDRDEGTELVLELENLPELEQGVYEGWAIDGDEKLSTGTFAAAEEVTVTVDRDLEAIDEVVVTIEPEDDDDPAPSGVVILHGELEGRVAGLECPIDLEGASGSFLLNTPTSPVVTPESGVWFLQPDGEGGHEAALDLPELPEGWTYEGWVVHEGVPITTGRFDDPTTADEFDGYSGRADAPPFPGEDLVTNEPTDDLVFPTDLTDGESKVVVSVEPDVDGHDPTGPGPFAFKPLASEIPADAAGGENYDLGDTGLALPSGAAVVEGDGPTGVPIGDGVARDLNGDGYYRDVDGDGDLDNNDVTTFFEHHWKDDVAENGTYFDFSGNGEVNAVDVVELFEHVTTQV